MRVVVFSTNPSIFNSETFFINAYPSWYSQWQACAARHKDLELFIVAAPPALFLFGPTAPTEAGEPNLHIISLENSQPKEAAERIAALSPDIAVAASSWSLSYDWLPLNDAVTASILTGKGIKTICNSRELSINCFNKAFTHQMLEKHGFLMPRHIYVNHEMYKGDLKKAGANFNAYREYILSELSQMTFPLVIKPVAGVSSMGIRLAESYPMALAFLDSKRNGSDHIVEEYIKGRQMGLEIHGRKNNYTVLPPLEFSLNNHGITNPRQSIKKGPVSQREYPLEELYKEMERLAQILAFSGTLQVDLVYSQDRWYILELNSRLSGMTASYAAAMGTSVPEMLLQDAGLIEGLYRKGMQGEMQAVVSIKVPVQDEKSFEFIKEKLKDEANEITCFYDSAASQEREKGYCELIFSRKSKEEIDNIIEIIGQDFLLPTPV